MKKQDINNINSINNIATNMTSQLKNSICGLGDESLKFSSLLYLLYKNHLNINPKKSSWFNRDRFIFSLGSTVAPIYYSTLYHFGYKISELDLKQYGNKNSKLPIIPSHHSTEGVDATTFPLGQDIGEATGLALAQKFVSKKLNLKQVPYTYILCMDLTMQSGTTYEAMSFAGHFKLNNLIIININSLNKVPLKNKTFNDDLKNRAQSSLFNYINISTKTLKEFEKDFNQAITQAKNNEKPTIINIETINIEKLYKAKETSKNNFNLDKEIKNNFSTIINDKLNEYKVWNKKIGQKLLKTKIYNDLLKMDRSKIDLIQHFKTSIGKKEMLYLHNKYHCVPIETPNTSSLLKVQEKLATLLPSYLDGTIEAVSSDSVQGTTTNFKSVSSKNILFGFRDALMPSVANGMSYFEGLNPAFFIDAAWIDYILPGLKTASILKQNILITINYMFALPGIKLSQYHKIVEQMTILRTMKNIVEWKPIDAHEGLLAYNMYLKSKNQPVVILLRNEIVETMSDVSEKDFAKGAYILKKEKSQKFKTIICSGGEMEYVYKAFKNRDDIRIVSMPSHTVFRKQSKKFKSEIIPDKSKSYYIEISSDYGAYEFANTVFGIDSNIYKNSSKNMILSISKLRNLL